MEELCVVYVISCIGIYYRDKGGSMDMDMSVDMQHIKNGDDGRARMMLAAAVLANKNGKYCYRNFITNNCMEAVDQV